MIIGTIISHCFHNFRSNSIAIDHTNLGRQNFTIFRILSASKNIKQTFKSTFEFRKIRRFTIISTNNFHRISTIRTNRKTSLSIHNNILNHRKNFRNYSPIIISVCYISHDPFGLHLSQKIQNKTHFCNQINFPIFIDYSFYIRNHILRQFTRHKSIFIICNPLFYHRMLQRRSSHTKDLIFLVIKIIIFINQNIGANSCSSIKRKQMSRTRNISGFQRSMTTQRKISYHVINSFFRIITRFIHQIFQKLLIPESSCSRCRRLPIRSAPHIFNKLRKPCKFRKSIINHMIWNPNRKQSSFRHTTNTQRKISQFPQLFKFREICIIRIKRKADYIFKFTTQIFNVYTKEILVPKFF